MDKQELVERIETCRKEWEAVIADLGPEGLERPGAVGEWRVRDVFAHFNGWDRWQMVQLRTAFSGEVPTMDELVGGLDYPDEEEGHTLTEDERNAIFYEINKDRPLDDVVGDWREIFDFRAAWVGDATQERLDEQIGGDWTGGTTRVFRLMSEVPGAAHPKPASAIVLDQIGHQLEHLGQVKEWMGR